MVIMSVTNQIFARSTTDMLRMLGLDGFFDIDGAVRYQLLIVS